MPIGDEIKKAREALKLSQMELSRRSGVPRSMLRRVEEGENTTVDTLQAIVAYLPNLEALHLGRVKLLKQNDLHEAMNNQINAVTALLETVNRLVQDLGKVATTSAAVMRTAEATGALAPTPRPEPEPEPMPVEPPLPPDLAEHFRELDRSIDEGKPLVYEGEKSEG
jgi:transcriptional regulator with XRE-family HTH domain